MTLIGAFDCGDYLLFAADSGVAAGHYWLAPETKIHRRDAPPLAWSFSGDEGLGYGFREWFETQQGGWTGWDHFRQSIVAEVARRNGQRKQEMMWAGNPNPNENELFKVLFAGYIQDKKRILLIETNGGSAFQEHRRWVLAGAGESAARFVLAGIARERNVEVDTVDPTPELVRAVLETTVDHMRSALAPPVRMVRITPIATEDA